MALPANPAWAQSLTRVDELRAAGIDGGGQLVAVIDRGVDTTHAALTGRVARSLVVNPTTGTAREVEGRDATGHGTATASLLAGRPVDGVEIGVAPGARVLAIDALGERDVLAAIVAGMEAAAAGGAAIVCLALGTRAYQPILAAAAGALRRRGVLTVASAGNDGAGAIRSPADFAEVLSVGACDRSGRVLSDSGSEAADGGCRSPDIVAPGAGVRVAAPGGGWQPATGTSYATALVAGIVALLRGARPDATAAQLHWSVASSARPTHADDGQRSRRGCVDAAAALALLDRRHTGGDWLPERPSVAAGERWVDPFAAELLDRIPDDQPFALVVAPHPDDPDSLDAMLAGSPASAGCRIVTQPLTRTAIVSGRADAVHRLTGWQRLHVVAAARVDVAPVTARNAISRRLPSTRLRTVPRTGPAPGR